MNVALAPAVEDTIQRLGPGRPVHDIRTVESYVADASADTRFALFVLGAFALLAVVLTAIGVYGVVAYATARRTREIAVRLALGADARGIVALVVRDGLGLNTSQSSRSIGGLPDPGFIATSRRRGPTHRHRGGADQRARCPTMR